MCETTQHLQRVTGGRHVCHVRLSKFRFTRLDPSLFRDKIVHAPCIYLESELLITKVDLLVDGSRFVLACNLTDRPGGLGGDQAHFRRGGTLTSILLSADFLNMPFLLARMALGVFKPTVRRTVIRPPATWTRTLGRVRGTRCLVLRRRRSGSRLLTCNLQNRVLPKAVDRLLGHCRRIFRLLCNLDRSCKRKLIVRYLEECFQDSFVVHCADETSPHRFILGILDRREITP